MQTAENTQFQAHQEVVDAAAAACARKLAKWFGSESEAIAAIEADLVAMAQIAMAAFIEEQRAMSVKVHMNPGRFSRQVLGQLV